MSNKVTTPFIGRTTSIPTTLAEYVKGGVRTIFTDSAPVIGTDIPETMLSPGMLVVTVSTSNETQRLWWLDSNLTTWHENKWEDGYFVGTVFTSTIDSSSGELSIGGTNATSVNISRSGQTTFVNGHLNVTNGSITAHDIYVSSGFVIDSVDSSYLFIGYNNAAAVVTGGQILPKTDNVYSIGSSSNKWSDGYFGGTITSSFLNVAFPNSFGSSFQAGTATSGPHSIMFQTTLSKNNDAGLTLWSTEQNISPQIKFQNATTVSFIWNEYDSGTGATTLIVEPVVNYPSLYVNKIDNRPGSVIAGGLSIDKTYNDAAFLARNRWEGAPAAVIAKRTSDTTADLLQVTDETLAIKYFRVSAAGDGYFAQKVESPSFDAHTSGALTIASTNATSVTIGQTAVTNTTINGKLTVDSYGRLHHSGTTPIAGDFSLSAGWGDTASVSSITGSDSALRFTITSSGTGQGADPTIIYTFKDGTMNNAPIALVALSDASNSADFGAPLTWTTTATTLTITFRSTPVDTRTYVFSLMLKGVA